ncbi:MAG: F0F1 ATP synthase subunit A, partial [Thermoleophilia bacterium]
MTTSAASAEQPRESGGGLSTRTKVLIFLGIYLGVAILLYVTFGSDGENQAFQPQEEFRLTPWIEIKIGSLDLSINKAVLYLFLTCVATIGAMVMVARRMQQKPNRTQVIVEGAYDLTYTQIARGNMPSETAARYFPFVATLFFFIWFSNMLGYIPLPTNNHETIDIFGIDFPAFALYAA